MLEYATLNDAYADTLRRLLYNYHYECSPRGLRCTELVDHAFMVLTPKQGPVITQSVSRNEVMTRYLDIEKRLYLSGELRADVWANKASKFWANLANPDGTINSNYGHLILRKESLPNFVTPWRWARECLKKDPDSRQAYIRVALPEHQWDGNKDQVCTLHINYLIRGGRLHSTVVMRSNDVVKGLPYDAPWFIDLQYWMSEELKISVGTYTHFAHSMHLYEKDVPVAKAMIGDA